MRSIFANIAIALSIALLLFACAPVGPTGAATANMSNTSGIATVPEAPSTPEELPPVEESAKDVPKAPEPTPGRFTIMSVEGDLVQLKPQAIDPDGDQLIYSFTAPLDKDGRWQTKIGDEGKHSVVVGVTDGKSTTTETVDIIVARANRPPVIQCRNIVVDEGMAIDMRDQCAVTDEDDADLSIVYSGYLSGPRKQVSYEDAGEHTVTITASDRRAGEVLHKVEQQVKITVKNVNRAPVFSDKFPAIISATENDVLAFPRDAAYDPDGDKVTFTFSPPFSESGVWKTKIGDAGTYDVDVVISDGQLSAKRTVKIGMKMLNTAPVLKSIPDITVKEGETIKLPINAIDREGDKLTTKISGWLLTETYKTTYEDAGKYTVKVSVSDGELEASQVVHVEVTDVNRAPVFITPA
jgi:hypothetical protein